MVISTFSGKNYFKISITLTKYIGTDIPSCNTRNAITVYFMVSFWQPQLPLYLPLYHTFIKIFFTLKEN